MIRVAAVGDVHAGVDSAGSLRPRWDRLADEADCLLLAGDLTKGGEVDEAAVLAGELDGLGLPVIAVLGNHDHHAGTPDAVSDVLTDAGITVLEGEASLVEVDGGTLGVVGAKGFGGGFEGAMATEFGEEEMKAFVRHTRERAEAIDRSLRDLEAEVRIALLHYAPVRDTLMGEPPEIFPFLGSYLLAEPCDRAGIDLIVHGHAHRGQHEGTTNGGVPVRNVAMPVIERAYVVFSFDDLDHSDRAAGSSSPPVSLAHSRSPAKNAPSISAPVVATDRFPH